jgi:hypothetical protein
MCLEVLFEDLDQVFLFLLLSFRVFLKKLFNNSIERRSYRIGPFRPSSALIRTMRFPVTMFRTRC